MSGGFSEEAKACFYDVNRKVLPGAEGGPAGQHEEDFYHGPVPGLRPSSTRAELPGLLAAMLSKHPENVAADNKTAVAAAARMTKGILGGKEKPWQLRANSDILMVMDKVMQRRGRGTMTFQWMPSHQSEEDVSAGRIDQWRWRGNSKADDAATAGKKMQ